MVKLKLDYDNYQEAREKFEWDIPEDFNAAYDLLKKHEDRDKDALYQAYPNGRRENYSFRELDKKSSRMANALESEGIGRRDRVGVYLPQKLQNPVTHLACWKMGAISVPLSVLFGEDALKYRLKDCDIEVLVADEQVAETAKKVRDDVDSLEKIVVVGDDDRVESFESFVKNKKDSYEIVETTREDPMTIIYTSGSTGDPKGVLHTHDLWAGHAPAFHMYFETDLEDSVIWTPADWAWIGALGDILFAAWHLGKPVVGYPMKGFDPEEAFELMEEFDVTDSFLPPTAIRMMMDVENPNQRYDLSLDVTCSGGEPLTPEILEWADEELEDSVDVNEIYGQTEANLFVCNNQEWFDQKAGSMGKIVPGHEAAILDPETGEEKDVGEIGELALKKDQENPVLMEKYWNKPEKTENSEVSGYHLTGDLAKMDEDGHVWFKSRDDHLIITSGYRVGPEEVEQTILKHQKVEEVGVIGVPHQKRGEIIKACIKSCPGVEGSEDLKSEIQQFVKDRLAKHEYPREIEFMEDIPTTTTGKVDRTELKRRYSE